MGQRDRDVFDVMAGIIYQIIWGVIIGTISMVILTIMNRKSASPDISNKSEWGYREKSLSEKAGNIDRKQAVRWLIVFIMIAISAISIADMVSKEVTDVVNVAIIAGTMAIGFILLVLSHAHEEEDETYYASIIEFINPAQLNNWMGWFIMVVIPAYFIVGMFTKKEAGIIDIAISIAAAGLGFALIMFSRSYYEEDEEEEEEEENEEIEGSEDDDEEIEGSEDDDDDDEEDTGFITLVRLNTGLGWLLMVVIPAYFIIDMFTGKNSGVVNFVIIIVSAGAGFALLMLSRSYYNVFEEEEDFEEKSESKKAKKKPAVKQVPEDEKRVAVKQVPENQTESDESVSEEESVDETFREHLARAVIYIIKIPRKTEWNPEQALYLMEQLAFSLGHFEFRIYADSKGIQWQMVDVWGNANPEMIEELLRSVYPEIEIIIQTRFDHTASQYPVHRYISYYQVFNQFVAPLAYVGDLKKADPLMALTEIMSGLKPHERIVYSLIIEEPASPKIYLQGEHDVTQSTIHPLQFLSRRGIGDAMGKMITRQHRMRKFEHRDQNIMEEKLRQKLYVAFFLFQVEAPEEERLLELAIAVDTLLSKYSRMPYNSLKWVERPIEKFSYRIDEKIEDVGVTTTGLFETWMLNVSNEKWETLRLVMEPREMAALWHLPNEKFSAPGIQWVKSGQVSLPQALKDQYTGIYLGAGKYRGKEIRVHLKEDDRRTHINIVGKTGMGKSTLMHHLIHQDIASGKGVVVLDPHGTLIEAILQCSIPPGREGDVVVLDLNNQDYPPPINAMRGHGGQASSGKVLNIIERLFEGTDQATQLIKYLQAALGLLQKDPQATMRDISHVFKADDYRYRLLKLTRNPFVEDVWEEFERQSVAKRGQIHEPVISRIAPFYGNEMLYPMLCHPDALDFRQLLLDRKILLISLAMSEEHVSDKERDLIGGLVVSMLQIASMQAQLDHPCYVYIDEVQRFVTTSLSILLSEARKFGLSLTIANQFLGQLSGSTLEAVMGNVGTSLAFRCSPDDASALGAYMRPKFDKEALVNLHQFQMAVKMQSGGTTQPAFTLWTPEPLPVPDDAKEREARIRELSIQRYTPKSQSDILQWLEERYPKWTPPVENEEDTFIDKKS